MRLCVCMCVCVWAKNSKNTNVDNGKSQAKERNAASVCAEVVAIFWHLVILRPLVAVPAPASSGSFIL